MRARRILFSFSFRFFFLSLLSLRVTLSPSSQHRERHRPFLRLLLPSPLILSDLSPSLGLLYAMESSTVGAGKRKCARLEAKGR
jgi:hypothetical protein